MELKKSKKANLENKKSLFFQIALIVTLAGLLSAFEWSSGEETAFEVSDLDASEDIEEEMINTYQQETPPPPPPPKPQFIQEINILEDDVEIDDDMELEDLDTDIDDEVAVDVIEDEVEEEDDNQVFFIVENMPEFPGGEQAMRAFIARNVKYPEIAIENGIAGKVIVSFVVNKDGKPTKIKVMRGVDPVLDKEAIAVIKKMPKFKPGMQRGKPVNVSFIVPVSFALE